MPIELSQGFRFGAFTAEPLKGSVAADDGQPCHLAPKAMDVLVRLAEAAPKPVTREDLITAVWGERYVSDEVLTHAIKELRHALGDSPTKPKYIQTIPKRGYRLLRKARPITDPRPVKEGRKWSYQAIAAALVIAILALGWFVGDFGQDTESAVAPTAADEVAVSGITVNPSPRIAVLPFEAMSNGPDDAEFADGLSEELRTALSQLPDLRVIARTSSNYFRDKDIPIPEIADLLDVTHIVEGSVRRDGQRLRITSQLIRAADGFHLWSQTYDRELEDVFYVQQEIAEKVAEALDVMLDDEARERMNAMRINNVDAFIAYQKGLEFYENAHDKDLPMLEGLATANEYFDKALDAQPDLYAARVLRSDRAGHVLVEMILNEEPDIRKVKDQQEAGRTELDLAWRALPNGNQRDILDLERTLASDNWTGLAAKIQKAMQPGNCPRVNKSEFIINLGFAEEFAGKLEESLACNPLDADVIYRLAFAYNAAGRPDEALDLVDRAETIGVNSRRFIGARRDALFVAGRIDEQKLKTGGKTSRLILNVYEGNHAEARRIAQQIWTSDKWNPRGLLQTAAIMGDRARANEFATRIDKYSGSAPVLLHSLAYCYVLGRHGLAKGCRNGVPFDLAATPNLKSRIEESGLVWPPVAYRDISTEDSQ